MTTPPLQRTALNVIRVEVNRKPPPAISEISSHVAA
jgi:hypothetical protein